MSRQSTKISIQHHYNNRYKCKIGFRTYYLQGKTAESVKEYLVSIGYNADNITIK